MASKALLSKMVVPDRFLGLALLSTGLFAPRSLVCLGWAFLLTALAIPALRNTIENMPANLQNHCHGPRIRSLLPSDLCRLRLAAETRGRNRTICCRMNDVSTTKLNRSSTKSVGWRLWHCSLHAAEMMFPGAKTELKMSDGNLIATCLEHPPARFACPSPRKSVAGRKRLTH